ncbi:MAG: Serine phosphatase RsbU, regulator of sigma subunit [uncultured Actinomycetospora sp.]|uniref:Serine phosphatase RsbU, regulator of sigma subunit n=1 Tax=uncultured Actinomycetospora sp. TaxID=1135996 RepID=A0A6J4K6H1_9PSEU|nr:MAG: Serine phosphatase RsbU, regulator of sigma subunit [uncultured Actinomycetospora sp.]
MGPTDDTDAVRAERLHHSELIETAEDLYDNAPCGYLSTTPDGHIVRINATLLRWLGYEHDQVVGHMRFADLLTVGGRMYHETHFAPLLLLQGSVHSVALEVRTADRRRLPVLVDAVVKEASDDGPSRVRIMVIDAADRRAYEVELLRARRQADLERDRLEQLATTLQRTLLPPALPGVPGLDIAAYYHSASVEEIGGDFYDLFPLAHDRWGFFLGDVCGKGPGAAVLTSLIRYTLRAAAVYDSDPVSVLTTLNTSLRQERGTTSTSWCTLIYGVLVPADPGFTVTLASGGHPPALVVPRDAPVEAVDTVGGQPVGLLARPRFRAITTTLRPGDGLLLHTDGLTEARRPDGTMLDEDLPALVAELPRGTARGVVDGLADVLSSLGSGLVDDAAIMVFTAGDR